MDSTRPRILLVEDSATMRLALRRHLEVELRAECEEARAGIEAGMEATMKPYYVDGDVALYRHDCLEVLPALGVRPEDVALLWADPPYGVREKTDRRSRSRGINKALPRGGHRARARDWAPVEGDDRPFDPSPWLGYPRVVLWGANHFAQHLPPSPSWWCWDKRAGTTPDDNADCELAWTNLGGPARHYSHLWRGL